MDIPSLQAAVVSLLHEYGPRMAAGLPVEWRVHHFSKVRYAIAALLVLTDRANTEDELAVVTVYLSSSGPTRWIADAAGPDSTFIAELAPGELQGELATDPAEVRRVIGAFLDSNVDQVRDAVAAYFG